ncbi:hypothetical protein V6N12_076126 [Hibiscus sabdariffa]|uniref:Uncharacterized protein n=1 Tax=Hibiscus sabdariffa TaxID=183260 RepID=A0ABR2AZZ1_9ROSI
MRDRKGKVLSVFLIIGVMSSHELRARIRMLEFRGGYISVGSVGSSEGQDPSKSGSHFDTFPRVTRFFTLSHALSTKTTGPSCKSRKIHSLSLLQGQEMGMNARLFDSSSI